MSLTLGNDISSLTSVAVFLVSRFRRYFQCSMGRLLLLLAAVSSQRIVLANFPRFERFNLCYGMHTSRQHSPGRFACDMADNFLYRKLLYFVFSDVFGGLSTRCFGFDSSCQQLSWVLAVLRYAFDMINMDGVLNSIFKNVQMYWSDTEHEVRTMSLRHQL